MSNTLKIRRKEPIYLEEWILVLNSIDNLRLCKGQFHVTKGADGVASRVPVEEGDAEICIEGTKEWVLVYHYLDDELCVSFDSPQGAAESQIWTGATSIAKALEAKIFGQDGESYDLTTLEVTKDDPDAELFVHEREDDLDEDEDIESDDVDDDDE